MTDRLEYLWILRWRDFQHYPPRRDRAPTWIKNHLAQLDDERYLQLSDRQRALLQDLRMVFARTRNRLVCDQAVIARHRHRRTLNSDLEALNHAGFIEFISRATLEERLEKLYTSRAPARSPEVEVEEEKDTPLGVASLLTTPQSEASYAADAQPLDGASSAEKTLAALKPSDWEFLFAEHNPNP